MIYSLPMTISLAVLSGLITIETLFVCYLVLRFKELRSYTNGFVFSLAVADLLYGAIVIPIHLAMQQSLLHNYLLALVLLSNIFTLVAVTLDRYLAVMHTLVYHDFMKRHFWKVVFLSWAIPIAIGVLPLSWGSDMTHKAHKIYIFCLIAVGIVLPFLFILVAYVRIFIRVHQHVRYIMEVPTTAEYKEAISEGKRVSAEAQVARLFAIVAAIFLISWMPVIYMTFVANIDRYDLIPIWLGLASWITLSTGSLVNAPIYAFAKRDFRAVIKRFLSPVASTSRQEKENEAEGHSGKYNQTIDVTEV